MTNKNSQQQKYHIFNNLHPNLSCQKYLLPFFGYGWKPAIIEGTLLSIGVALVGTLTDDSALLAMSHDGSSRQDSPSGLGTHFPRINLPPHCYGAAPSISPNQQIQNALQKLRQDECIYVDTLGEVHNDKDIFVSGERNILFTAKANDQGSYEISSCLRPVQSLLVRGKHQNLPPGLLKLKYALSLNSGDILFFFSGHEIEIPSTPIQNPEGPCQLAQAKILSAKPGEFVTIGRSFQPGFPESVSRIHASLQIERNDIVDNKHEIQVRIWFGLPSTQDIFVIGEGSERHPIHGCRTLTPGANLDCGPVIGIVEIPPSHGSIDEESQTIYMKLTEMPSDPFATMMAQRGPHTAFFAQAENLGAVSENQLHSPEIQRKILELHITKGIELITQNRFSEAIQHFSNVEILVPLGYTFEVNNHIGLNSLDENAVRENIEFVASRSWFNHNQKQVYPSLGILTREITPKNEIEKIRLRHWQRELSLIYAEEWTHALQHASGGLISKKGAILTAMGCGNEADVAIFFHEHGQPLSYHFIKGRYDERAYAFQLIQGVQSPSEQNDLRSLYQRLSPGSSIYIGSAPSPKNNGDAAFKIGGVVDHSPNAHILRSRAISRFRENEAILTKLSSGALRIESVGRHLFVPEETGRYYELQGSTNLEPGSPFYLGACFRFEVW